MTINTEDAISKLAKSVKDRTLVLFCGAGVSVGADPPLMLANDYLIKYGLENYSWLEGAARLTKMDNFKAEFKREFGDSNRKPSEQHRLLACLDAPYYITTNYDDLIEKALKQLHCIKENDRLVGVINKNDVSSVFSYSNLVIKLHGDIESDELLVFTEKQYFNRIKQPNDVDGFIKLLFTTHTVLFVGYSVSDINVLSMLGNVVESAPRHTPSKYALLNCVDKRTKQKLKDYDIEPIDLEANEHNYDKKVCDFLYRLWEQNEYYGTYTKIIEKAPATVEESLEHAITLRQNNQLMQAKQLLQTLYKYGIANLPFRQLPAFLWLVVSIEDKREEWGFLEHTNDLIINPLLKKIESTTSAKIAESLKAVYNSSLAIAFCRAGDYDKAFKCLTEAGIWRCTNTADRGYQLVTANLLTAHALVLLHLSTDETRQNDKEKHLKSALESLDAAWELFKQHGQLNKEDESHHLGRFYGTKVFLTITCIKAGLVDCDNNDLINYASHAHSPMKNRTKFGNVAGLYCEAVCYYWLANRVQDKKEIKKFIKLAIALITKARKNIDEKQKTVSLKLDLLDQQLSKMRCNFCSTRKKLQPISEDRFKCLPELLQRKVRTDPEKWLFLPLN